MRAFKPHGLFFDYVSNQGGFDTEIALINTSQDWIGTTPDNGSCTVNVPGRDPFVTPNIFAGQSYSVPLSTIAPGYAGWISAECEFQGERGFAKLSSGAKSFGHLAENRFLAGAPVAQRLLFPLVDEAPLQNLLVLTNSSEDLMGTTTPASGTCLLDFPWDGGFPQQSVALAAGEQVAFRLSDGLASKGVASAPASVSGSLAIHCDFSQPRAMLLSHAGTGAETTVSFVQKAEQVLLPRTEPASRSVFTFFGDGADANEQLAYVHTGSLFGGGGGAATCDLHGDQIPLSLGEQLQFSLSPPNPGFLFLSCDQPFVRGQQYRRRILPPAKLGVFINGSWFLDRDGDFAFDPATEISGWGSPGDTPVRGDWNGDGFLDLGVFSGGLWFIDSNGDGAFEPSTDIRGWGAAGWIPTPGDWNGDGVTDLGAVDPSTSAWFRDLNGDFAFDPATEITGWGSPGDTPIVADWNGDGRDDVGVFSGGTWFIDANGDGAFDPATDIQGWGAPGWIPMPGDWNGDGQTDLGAVDPTTSAWFLDRDGDFGFDPATEIVGWGSPGDVPVATDWNGDGRDDVGVFSGGVWFIDRNGDWSFDPATEIQGWGAPGWTPAPGRRR